MHTPRSRDLSARLVAFEIAGIAPSDVVKQLLARQIIASTSPYAITYARLAPSLVNTRGGRTGRARGAGNLGLK